MDGRTGGGWLHIMSDRLRGATHTGVTGHLGQRLARHRSGDGSDFRARYGPTRLVRAERGPDITLPVPHGKRIKKRRREWRFELIERGDPDRLDLFGLPA